jgi:hypothetical protein
VPCGPASGHGTTPEIVSREITSREITVSCHDTCLVVIITSR